MVVVVMEVVAGIHRRCKRTFLQNRAEGIPVTIYHQNTTSSTVVSKVIIALTQHLVSYKKVNNKSGIHGKHPYSRPTQNLKTSRRSGSNSLFSEGQIFRSQPPGATFPKRRWTWYKISRRQWQVFQMRYHVLDLHDVEKFWFHWKSYSLLFQSLQRQDWPFSKPFSKKRIIIKTTAAIKNVYFYQGS